MFRLTIMPDGEEPFTVVAKSRDVAFWERTVHGASLAKIANNPTMSAMEEFAYCIARRRGKFVGDIEEFRKTCDFEMDEDEESNETNPTQTAL